MYEKASNVLACGFLHTDRSKLSKLRFDLDSYNVVIHLRVGDMVLHGANAFSNPFRQRDPALHGHDASGFAYCSTMKRELDQVLSEFDRIHYIFIDEEPEAGEAGPPQELAFLSQIFRSEDEGGRSVRVSYLNDLDPRESLYHMMNGDMLISPGSSFPAIAATLSPKPVVLLSKPYVGRTFPARTGPTTRTWKTMARSSGRPSSSFKPGWLSDTWRSTISSYRMEMLCNINTNEQTSNARLNLWSCYFLLFC